MPGKAHFIQPILALRTEKLPEASDWAYELKLDGYRAIAYKSGRKLLLRSRNDKEPERLSTQHGWPMSRKAQGQRGGKCDAVQVSCGCPPAIHLNTSLQTFRDRDRNRVAKHIGERSRYPDGVDESPMLMTGSTRRRHLPKDERAAQTGPQPTRMPS